MVMCRNLCYCRAVGDDRAFEAPLFTQYVCEQERISAARYAVERIVGAHKRGYMRFLYACPESGEIVLAQ